MSQTRENDHEFLQSLIDRLDSQISDGARAKNARRKALVAHVTKSQMRQVQAAKVIWALGILLIAASTVAGWIRWYMAVIAALAWMIAWNALSRRIIKSVGLYRIKKGTLNIMKEMSE